MVKIVKNPGNGRLNNLNDPRPQCVNIIHSVHCSRNIPFIPTYAHTYLLHAAESFLRSWQVFS